MLQAWWGQKPHPSAQDYKQVATTIDENILVYLVYFPDPAFYQENWSHATASTCQTLMDIMSTNQTKKKKSIRESFTHTLLPLLARGLVNDHSGFGPAGDAPTLVPRLAESKVDGSEPPSFLGAVDPETIENDEVEELPRKRGELWLGDRNPAPDASPGASPPSSCPCWCLCDALVAAAPLPDTIPPFSFALRSSVARSGLLAKPGERNMERRLFCSSSESGSTFGGTSTGDATPECGNGLVLMDNGW